MIRAIVLGDGQHAHILGKLAEDWYPIDVLMYRTDNTFVYLPIGVTHFINGIGGVADNRPRKEAWGAAIQFGLQPYSITHPLASDESWQHGLGLIAMNHACIGPGVMLGDNVLINTGAIIEHDCAIGDHVHIAPGAILCGNVTVGEGAHIGAGAVVRQGIHIGAWSVVGCGAVVVKDVPDGVTVVGNPARPIKRQE